jgi:hypothetical protein
VLRAGVRVGKGGNFEKGPVSSMELGYHERGLSEKKRDFPIKFHVDGDMELLLAGC